MKKAAFAVAATLAVAAAVPATAGSIDAVETPIVTAPVTTATSSVSPLLIVGGLALIAVAAAGDS